MAKKKTSSTDEFQTRTFLQRVGDPVFLLNRKRRLRFANAAFEQLAGQSLEDAYDLYCTRNAESRLARTLAPPAEVLAGSPARVRRSPPKAKFGPPWWDIAFLPLSGTDGLFGIIGRVRVVGPATGVRGRPLPEGLLQLRHRLPERYRLDSLISDVPACEQLLQQVRLAAQHRMPVTLVGELGTGKRWLARVIHHCGVTAEQSLVAVDCGGLPASAVGNLLFGEAGLGRPDRTGTVYLDDPTRLARDLQTRLADWLRERPTDGPRVAAGFASEPNTLEEDVLVPRLRLGLTVQTIRVPPLRERIDDLPRLAGLFLERAVTTGAPACPGIAAESLELLREYRWPGNLRELDAAINGAARRANGATIELAHWPEAIRQTVARQKVVAATPGAQTDATVPLDTLLEHVERRMIVLAMRKAKGLQAEAAQYLGIWPPRLSRRLQKLQIRDDEWRTGPPREHPTDETPPDRGVRE
jgi:transcriptional regulator with PAS, ATPase and Fis domain